MDGAGKKLWGYYPTTKTWVPLQVDADGKVKVDLSAVNLDDLGDVSVPTPGDQYLLYWDAATSLWKCRALVDSDIPASIARDAEVTDAIATHKADASAHHTKTTAASEITSGRFGMPRMPDGTNNYVLTAKGAGVDPAYAAVSSTATLDIMLIIGDGINVINTGQRGHIPIDFACTIKQVTMVADVSGSIVVDIWKDTYANFPPTDADSITASTPPTISSAQKSQDATLTGWTTAIAAGDILAFNVDSCTTIKRVTISLKVERS
jgi:hypothetical protein